ncbi:MAG: ATP-dependent DNA helicase RecG [Acidobacteria bacterium]|nr:ATP-dependent DNA helicase RecG [Acidobacteriota bacterium]
MSKPPLRLDTPIQFVKGVGPRRASDLSKERIATVEDFLLYLPFRYEDRSKFKKISELRDGEVAVVLGQVALTGIRHAQRKRLSILEVVVRDESALLGLKFFNQPFLKNIIRRGDWVVAYGEVRWDPFKPGRLSMQHAEFEIIDNPMHKQVHVGRITPIYRRIGTVSGKVIRQIEWDVQQEIDEKVPAWLPRAVEAKLGLPDRTTAVLGLHAPPLDYSKAERLKELNAFQSPFHFRLIVEEFFLFQTGLLIARQRREERIKDRKIEITDSIRERLKRMLPFHPTAAQKEVLREIVEDLQSRHPMNRLLQGDVGSGKTIVAAQAALVVVDNGWQVAVMAPTEILAEQHYRTFSKLFAPLGVNTALLSRPTSKQERSEIQKALSNRSLNLLIGTHALIQGVVQFSKLGFVIIDEQHRFGVMQRSALMGKGENVDTLIMTATPIPRSLAMTVYGDLDVSVIDQLPPGRKPIRTILKSQANREEVYELVEREIAARRQAYVVYPLIEESEKVNLRAVKTMGEELCRRFPKLRIGVLHGRLKPAEKDKLMGKFAAAQIDILAATTVVEVGIDVPNATVMVVEHAERFGLSQLHQLRGRVGRGAQESICVLLVDRVSSEDAWERLQIMKKSQDGFLIAEKDLEIRGPGEFAGTRQSGVPLFRHGNLLRDLKLMQIAREEAASYLRSLSGNERDFYVAKMGKAWQAKFQLSRVG